MENGEGFREYKGSKVRRLDSEERRFGGVPLGEGSLLLQRNVGEMFRAVATIGNGGRRAASEYLNGHITDVIERLVGLSMQKKDRIAGQWAGRVLSVLGYQCVSAMLKIALGGVEGSGKTWAGEVLARIEESLEKHAEKLGEVNAGYVATREALRELKRRGDVVADPGVIGQIVQKELDLAERYWERLRFYRRQFGDGWEKEVTTEIPRDYFAFEPLTAFCEKSLPMWWESLWPLIKKNNPEFMVALKEGKFPTLGIRKHMCWSRYWKDFRRPLRSLARQRGTGVTAL
jgi:hypothetical protein